MSLDLPGAPPVPADPTKLPHTVRAATDLLRSLKPRILELLAGEKLNVSLDRMHIMPPERRDPERAHVMWVGPAGGEKFKAVARTSA